MTLEPSLPLGFGGKGLKAAVGRASSAGPHHASRSYIQVGERAEGSEQGCAPGYKGAEDSVAMQLRYKTGNTGLEGMLFFVARQWQLLT